MVREKRVWDISTFESTVLRLHKALWSLTAQQRKDIWKTLELEIPKRVKNSLEYQNQFAIGGSEYYDLPPKTITLLSASMEKT